MLTVLEVTDSLSSDDEKAVRDPLVAYNIARFGKSDRRDLAILLRNTSGAVEGGLTGYTARGWLYVQMLFIPEELRGQGLSQRLLAMAETEAQTRGCIGAYLDTMNPDARTVYEKAGYHPLGMLEHLDGGHMITWLCKRF